MVLSLVKWTFSVAAILIFCIIHLSPANPVPLRRTRGGVFTHSAVGVLLYQISFVESDEKVTFWSSGVGGENAYTNNCKKVCIILYIEV